jgi:hypothetical protein
MLPQVFCVPNTWFGAFDPMAPVILQASLDGSYTSSVGTAGRRAFAYGGLAGFDDAWRVFAPGWSVILEANNLEWFRTSEARVLPGFTKLRQALGEHVRACGLHAIGCAVDLDLAIAQTEAGKKRDVFEHVIRQLVRVVPAEANFALLCDREQDLAKQVSPWLDRLGWLAQQQGRTDRLYERIVGICYINSKLSMQIQAADLVAGLFREHAEQQLIVPGSDPDPLLVLITEGRIAHKLSTRAEFLADLA